MVPWIPFRAEPQRAFGPPRRAGAPHHTQLLAKQGREATRAADQAIYDAVPDYRREVDQLFGDGESAASLWRFLGTGPAGAFELPLACFYKVRDGLIVECWIHADSGDLARALGMSAPEKAT